MMLRNIPVLALALLACGCATKDDAPASEGLANYIKGARVGSDPDQWIEMRNMLGEWERTGLIFGYNGDFDECQKAIAGLKRANSEREYRCVPAN